MADLGERLSGDKSERISEELWGGIHVEPGIDGSPVSDDRLEQILSEFMGEQGSMILPSRSSLSTEKPVEAASLIGDARLGGKANGWVEEALAGSDIPAARINRVCALAWLGFGRWINFDQDAANAYWSDARTILEGADWGTLEKKAVRLTELMRALPE